MSWKDEMRANGYVQAAIKANNNAELERGMQAADDAVELIDNVANAVGNVVKDIFSSSETPPTPKTSSGSGGLGLLVAGAALAGGAYLLSKAFESSDEDKNSKSSNQSMQQISYSPNPDTQTKISQSPVKTSQNITPAKQHKKNEPSSQFKSELANIKGLISNPKANVTKIKAMLYDIEEKVALKPSSVTMKKVAEYYKRIGCDYEADRCYRKAETFEEAEKKEIEQAKNADSHFMSGNDYLKQQKYEQAIQCYDYAIQLNPNYSLAYKNRGKCYQALGDNKNAQSDFSKAKMLRKKV